MYESSKPYLKEPYPRNLLLTASMPPLNLTIPKEDTPDVVAGVEHAVSLLPEREQLLIRLRFVERKTFKEIGCIFGLSVNRVRFLTNRALRHLREPIRWKHICDLLNIHDAK